MTTPRRRRREYASGSIYQRKDTGKWVGTYSAGWTERGTRRRVSVTGRTEAEVKRRLRDKIAAARAGSAAESSRATVKSWAEEWLTRRATTVRPKTYSTDRAAVMRWIIPTIGHVRLDALTPAHIRAVRQAVTREDSTTTALRHHRVLVKLLRDAIRDGHHVPARVLATEAPRVAVHDRDAMTVDQALAVLAEASRRPDSSRWVAALLQGMRQGECLGLTWPEVGEDRLTVSWQLQALPYADRTDRSGFRVPDGFEARQLDRSWHLVRPKSRAGWRVIALVPQMRALLDEWWQTGPSSSHGLVWPRPDGGPRRPADDRREWRELQAAAGVAHPSGRPYIAHEARHTTSTLLMALGVPESVRVAILGHSSIAVTRGYEHVEIAEQARALGAVAERLRLG